MADTALRIRYRLQPMSAGSAATVASWVRSDAELFWLAPSTVPPITAEKVLGWTRQRGAAFIYTPSHGEPPVGYAELNAMARDRRHLWIGHVLIDPALRGGGLGRALTAALVHRAFRIEGARRLSLVVFPENVSAVRCYEAAGFTLRGEENQCFGAAPQRFRLLRFERTSAD
ncbi:MAG TPA: GNAT family N-acetyltransferase [Phycisphaerae bacterium]|nr:GNAT family N-acetyltransferase [Phycisphaerales bacterium]HRX83630.1 GNAT family N-acetyltransferase [Phycisphaerae bacterium]